MEGVARETRDAWGQFADQFGPEFVSAIGLQDREVEVFAFTRRACDRHVVQTLGNIDPMRHIQRLVEK